MFEDDYPFPKVGYVNSLEGRCQKGIVQPRYFGILVSHCYFGVLLTNHSSNGMSVVFFFSAMSPIFEYSMPPNYGTTRTGPKMDLQNNAHINRKPEALGGGFQLNLTQPICSMYGIFFLFTCTIIFKPFMYYA